MQPIVLIAAALTCSCATRPEPGAARSADATAVAASVPVDAVRPLAPSGLRQELKHLAHALHKIDLDGPPVKTNGRDENFQLAEWPFMAVAYFAYGCAELARLDEAARPEALAEARWCVQALQSRRLSGFIDGHYGKAFAETDREQGASAFFHGHFLNAALRYREASDDERFDPVIGRVAGALLRSYGASSDGVLSSYPTMYWLSDNYVALSALARYGRAFDKDVSSICAKAMATTVGHYLDDDTGLFATYVEPRGHRIKQGPRGISVMYGVVFLNDFAPVFARSQWTLAKMHLVWESMGFAAVREFPVGQEGEPDGDSGAVVFGLGLSASGFAIPAACVMDDARVGWSLMRAAVGLGVPVLEDGRLRYMGMPTVGQAVTFFGRVLLVHEGAVADTE